jgi:hypothetical protein
LRINYFFESFSMRMIPSLVPGLLVGFQQASECYGTAASSGLHIMITITSPSSPTMTIPSLVPQVSL